MRNELEKKLYDKYPHLFEQRHLNGYQTRMCDGCAHGDGWYNILDKMCIELIKIDTEKKISFSQIKEKFSTLRIYFDIKNEESKILYSKANQIIFAAETESCITCEECGKPGNKRPGSWIRTLCDDCDNKIETINELFLTGE